MSNHRFSIRAKVEVLAPAGAPNFVGLSEGMRLDIVVDEQHHLARISRCDHILLPLSSGNVTLEMVAPLSNLVKAESFFELRSGPKTAARGRIVSVQDCGPVDG
jgi:hypothetical protein